MSRPGSSARTSVTTTVQPALGQLVSADKYQNDRSNRPAESSARTSINWTRPSLKLVSSRDFGRALPQLRQDLSAEDIDPVLLSLPDVVQRDLIEPQLRVRGELRGVPAKIR
jgi:hypothetical protein